jgi:hypothetical protein
LPRRSGALTSGASLFVRCRQQRNGQPRQRVTSHSVYGRLSGGNLTEARAAAAGLLFAPRASSGAMRAEPVIGQRPLAFFHLPRAGRERKRPHRCWLCMGTRADQYRRKADRARERAQQARDPFVKLSYQELGRDWAALAEQAEWLDSHQQPRPRASQLALVEHQVSMSGSDHELDFHRWKMQPNSGSGRSTGRNAPPPRLTPKGANVGKEWLTPGTTPPSRQRERLR